MSRRDVLVLGVFAADLVFRAERLPAPGETLIGAHFSIGPGGKGSNQAIGAARLARGGSVRLITRIGRDAFGDLAMTRWREAGLRSDAVITEADGATGAAFIFVSTQTGENAIIIQPGAAGRLSPQDVVDSARHFDDAAIFITQLEQPLETARAGLALARAKGVTTILNPAPAQALPDDMLALADILTPNETEAGQLSGVAVHDEASALAAAQALRARGAGAVILTLGAKGALILDAQGATRIPALPGVTVIDTTGAGDAFNAGLAIALCEGRDLVGAARFGTAVAGLSVQRAGAAASMPSREDVEAALS